MVFTVIFGALIVSAALVFLLSALGTERPVQAEPGFVNVNGRLLGVDDVHRLPPEHSEDDEHVAAKEALETQARRQLTRILS